MELHTQTRGVTDDGLVFAPYCECTDKCSISAPINSLVLWLEVSGLKKDGLILSLRTQQPQNPDVVKERGLHVGEGK